APTEGIRLIAQHVRQPMRTLPQHIREQALDEAPSVVEPLEEELQIRAELRVLLCRKQRLARGPQVELFRASADRQLAPGPGRNGKLARQSEVEGVDGLDAQPAGILREPPAACLRALERRGRKLTQALGLRPVGDLAPQCL